MMVKRYLYLFLFVAGLCIVSCDKTNDQPNGYIEVTQDEANTLVLKGYESVSSGFSVFQPEDFETPFYIKEKQFYGERYEFAETDAKRLDEMETIPTGIEWQKNVAIVAGSTYWVRYSSLTCIKYVKMRVVIISGNDVTIEYVVGDTEERVNENANVSDAKVSVTNLEIPHLNAANYYVDHYVDYDGNAILNYALEWDNAKRHSAWVAFSFDDITCKDYVKRTDAWDVDPELPSEMQVSNDQHKNDGFDRGHICASEDRVYSVEANEQTFYFSNMSPMIGTFNQNYWTVFEQKVQTWGRSIPTDYDRLYVVKGGSLNHLLVSYTGTQKGSDGVYPQTDSAGYTLKGLACPQYYFIAVLSEKANVYHAIAFWVEHCEEMVVDDLKVYALSIDDLEKNTGLDFFCNLPDDVEDSVESSWNEADWAW